jgi:regulator of protease activity HflC (stomatin/prohibitin superfamily)
MKRIHVPAFWKGIVMKNGRVRHLLNEGIHWVGPGQEVALYDMSAEFKAFKPLEVYLESPDFRAMTEVVTVQEGFLALHLQKGILKNVLGPGQYVYWKGIVVREFIIVNRSSTELIQDVPAVYLNKAELLPYLKVYAVAAHEQGLLTVNKNFVQILQPGIYHFWRNENAIEVQCADLRLQQIEISGQELMTRDKAGIRINMTAQYQVKDIEKALLQNKDYDKQLYSALQLALREYCSAVTLDELLEKKGQLSAAILNNVQPFATRMGLTLLDCGIKDIILPGEIREIVNQVLIAEKKAQANLIMRREETASTRSLLNTAKMMEENEMLYKLKELEYVERIAEKINEIQVNGGDKILNQLKNLFA